MPSKKSGSKSKKKTSTAAKAMSAQAAQSTLVRNAIPQWFRLDPDQVQGNAGGFVWKISDKEQVIRYLIIGSEGGNYYQTPQQVSSQCASCVLRMTRTPDNFKWLCDTIRQVSIEGRAAKQEPTLLALATAIVFAPTKDAKQQALAIVNDCVRIPTHLYMLAGYIKLFSKSGHPNLARGASSGAASAAASGATPITGSGFGRGIRRVFGDYFYTRSGGEIANLITKYQNREGWTIKDILTLIHIDPKKMKDDGGRLAIDWVFKTKEEFAEILKAKNDQLSQNPSLGGGTPLKAKNDQLSQNPSLGGGTPLKAAPSTPTTTLFTAIKEIHAIAERPLIPAINPALANLSNYQYAEEITRAVHLINTAGLCREHIPSQLFKHRQIWEALLTSKGVNGKGKGMPLTALIRNLGKLTTAEIGIIDPKYVHSQLHTVVGGRNPQHYTEYIFHRLTDAQDIKRSRIHPYNILVAMLTYKAGKGDKGSLTWTPNIYILQALDIAFKLAFQNITPTGKRIKIALDVSGSMSSAFCTGSPIVNCATASVAMMMMTLWVERGVPLGVPPPYGGMQLAVPDRCVDVGWNRRNERSSVVGGRHPPQVSICAFSNTYTDLTNSITRSMDASIDPTTGLPTMTIADALKLVNMPFSSTDCALPMIRARENNEQVDAFVIYTDSETYMGRIHPQVALEEYRKASGINAKLIVVGMASNCLTIADPNDINTLNLAGFDTATPRIINDFIAGSLLPPPTPTAQSETVVGGRNPPQSALQSALQSVVGGGTPSGTPSNPQK
jgi:60 kDa SS-A/Ro ribonucleoprotein